MLEIVLTDDHRPLFLLQKINGTNWEVWLESVQYFINETVCFLSAFVTNFDICGWSVFYNAVGGDY